MSHAAADPTGAPPRRLPAVEERSAGGVVVDVHEGHARIAVIARRNRAGRVEWCLPKGHIEGDETLPQTAVREVAEETGVSVTIRELRFVSEFFIAGTEGRGLPQGYHGVELFFACDLTSPAEGAGTGNRPDQLQSGCDWLTLAELRRVCFFPAALLDALEAGQMHGYLGSI